MSAMLHRVVVVASLFVSAIALAQDAAPAASEPAGNLAPAASESAPSITTAVEAIAALEARGNSISDEEAANFATLIDAAVASEPTQMQWKYGQALLAARSRDFVKARDIMREVVKADATSATYHMARAGFAFMSINNAGTLDKMSLAEEGRDAYLAALKIDASLIEPRVGLAEYYIQAPGIAGGSWKKAGEQAQALIDLPEGRGEFLGYMMKGRIAMERERWKEMIEAFTLAETARGENASQFVAIISHANALLDKKEDAKAALAQAERAMPLAPANDYTAYAVLGRSKQQLKDWQGAHDAFEKVLALRPDAKLSRLGYAEALEKLGKQPEALQQYREFTTRFPNDDLADKANAAIARLNRAGIR